MDGDHIQGRIAQGATVGELAAEAGVDRSTMRRWLRRLGLRTKHQATRIESAAARSAGKTAIVRECARHGSVEHRQDARGSYRCSLCNGERVSARRRAVKRALVAEAGGRCVMCGYDRYAGALHFHHVDPSTKAFHLARGGVARSLAKARVEAAKCVLVCANCHAEVEEGLVQLPILFGEKSSDPG